MPKRSRNSAKPSKQGSKKPFLVVSATDARKVQLFRKALGVALKNADDTGGLYSAFLEVKEGTLQVEVQTLSADALHARVHRKK